LKRAVMAREKKHKRAIVPQKEPHGHKKRDIEPKELEDLSRFILI